MGQYYRIANLDKRETLDPFKFGSALKLTESCYVGDDYVDAITYLLANDWHGDRVLLCGDYAWSEEGGSAAGRLRVLAESDPFEASEGFLDRSGDFASVRGNEVYREIAPNLYGKVPVDGTFHIDAGHYRYVADLAKAVERMSGQTGQTVPTVTLTEAVISPCDSPESTERVLFCDQDGVDLDPDLDAKVFRFGLNRDELDSMIGVETGEGFIVREVGDSYDVVAHARGYGLDLDAEARDMRDTASSLSAESPDLWRDAIDR